MDVVNQEELQQAIDRLSPGARFELTACIYQLRWENARREIEQLRHSIAVHEENARLERPEAPRPPTAKEGAAAAARRQLAGRQAAETMAAINGELE